VAAQCMNLPSPCGLGRACLAMPEVPMVLHPQPGLKYNSHSSPQEPTASPPPSVACFPGKGLSHLTCQCQNHLYATL
jgi:hypothetical protein